MNMDGDDGLRFYVFDEIDDEKAFKTTYRAAMDELPIDQAMADRIVEEANHAFHLNMNMFKGLRATLSPPWQAAVRFPDPSSACRQHGGCRRLIACCTGAHPADSLSGPWDQPSLSLWWAQC